MTSSPRILRLVPCAALSAWAVACVPLEQTTPQQLGSAIIQSPATQSINVGAGVSAMAWGDVDRDGDLDLAVTRNNAAAHIYRNDDGILENSPIWTSTASTMRVNALAWGDLDGDGYPELAFAHNSGNQLTVYGNNAGVVTGSPIWNSGNLSLVGGNDTAWVDYDCDGDLDLSGAYSNGNIEVFDNNGGELAVTVSYQLATPANTATALAWGDRDGDGDPDLAVGTGSLSSTYIYDMPNCGDPLVDVFSYGPHKTNDLVWADLGGDDTRGVRPLELLDADADLNRVIITTVFSNVGGDGSENFDQFLPMVQEPRSIDVGDVDRDGDQDLAVGIFDSGAVIQAAQLVTFENSNGIMVNETGHLGISEPTNVAFADIDGDGDLELAVGTLAGQSIAILDNSGPEPPAVFSSSSTDQSNFAAWGDYDGDGDLDVFVANGSSQPDRLYRNDGGSLTTAFQTGESYTSRGAAWGDFDGDGDLDLAVANRTSQGNLLYRNNAGNLSLIHQFPEPDDSSKAAWGDLDNDGDLDLVFSGTSGVPTRIYRNTGSGLVLMQSLGAMDDSQGLDLADVDGDGDLDIGLANVDTADRVYQNDGNGNFSDYWTSPTIRASRDIEFGHIDDDATIDMVLALSDGGTMVLIGTVPEFRPVWESSVSDQPNSIDLADWDGDGDLDILEANLGSSTDRVYRNDNGNLSHWFSLGPLSRISSSARFADWDGDGDPDIFIARRGQSDVLYENRRIDDTSRTASSAMYAVMNPIGAGAAAAEGPFNSELMSWPNITVDFQLFDLESDPANRIVLQYSERGGGRWQTATTTGQVQNLAAGPNGVSHSITWRASLDGVTGHDLRLRLAFAQPSPQGIAFPQQEAMVVAESHPFRVIDCIPVDADGDGHYPPGTCLEPADDCDDANPDNFPGNSESCDGADNDCDGLIDGADPDVPDADLDGSSVCDDCDDGDPNNFPGNSEQCGDGVDNDCDLLAELSDPDIPDADGDLRRACPELDCDDADSDNWTRCGTCTDADGDGDFVDCDRYLTRTGPDCDDIDPAANLNDADGDGVRTCPGAGGTPDCDDNDAGNFPGNPEVCDGLDNDCDGLVDDADPNIPDADGDGEGFCTDCDDSDGSNFYGNTEQCGDDADNDCDGVDEHSDPDIPDNDNDGSRACADCDDNDPSARPGFTEICDGVDNNCDGVLLDGEGADADNDGALGCIDCNDADPNNFPGNSEVCDGFDNDCDTLVDGNDPDVPDADNDGWSACTDCDDNDPANFPFNTETCDGADNDCNGTVDDVDNDNDGYLDINCGGDDCDDNDSAVSPFWAEAICDGRNNDCDDATLDDGDADGDGFTICGADGIPYSADDDCDDNAASANPGISDEGTIPAGCTDLLDNDCDGAEDCGEPECSAEPTCLGCTDMDGDGVFDNDGGCAAGPPWDCDDNDPMNYEGNFEFCDGQDNDCDGLVDDDDPDAEDRDGDGASACIDCNDGNPAKFPGNPEICDGVDNDCNGLTDFGNPGISGQEDDVDGDGSLECEDCDDDDPDNYPGNTEQCDGQDNNCLGGANFPGETTDSDGDGVTLCTDCNDARASVYPGAPELCDGLDNDCNGAADFPDETVDADGDGSIACSDCDDADPDNLPGNPEVCDGRDNDCIGNTWAELGGTTGNDPATEQDGDGDGVLACLDCDDSDSANYPGNTEVCGDGGDNDCDGDGDDSDTAFPDGDGDGVRSCLDCDDSNPGRYPGNPDICDGIDNDCSGVADDGLSFDLDMDGHYSIGSCEQPADDCDDGRAETNPDAPEICDGLDNDCNGAADDGLNSDADGDGHYTPGSCAGPADDCDDSDPDNFPGNPELCDQTDQDCDGVADNGLSSDDDGDGHYAIGSCNTPADDCDDTQPAIFGGNGEACDGLDNNCDGVVDEGLSQDLDGDGHFAIGSCAGPADDCDDFEADRFGGNPEICDMVDNDCDERVDEGLSTDADDDGHYTPESCATPNDDCDDTRSAAHPGNTEICGNVVDEDCDGTAQDCDGTDDDGDGFCEGPGPCSDGSLAGDCDDSDPSLTPVDSDGDNFSPCDGDCDETDPDVLPGQVERCDGIDNDCNGLTDDDDPQIGDSDFDGTPDCTDCAPDDTDNWTQSFCDSCEDLDRDGSWVGCERYEQRLGEDCDDDDPLLNVLDEDGDGTRSCEGDCNDFNVDAAPGTPELCNGIDDNCDGNIDEGLNTDADGDGFFAVGGCGFGPFDCDDGLASVRPDANEIAGNGRDDDCDGLIDEDPLRTDDDGDGYCEDVDCDDGSIGGDCDDDNASVHPGGREVADGLDNDCDGTVDNMPLDTDGDGFTGDAGDCNDSDPNTFPAAPERCDGFDNNCDGLLPANEWDDDGDGFSACAGDCDDSDPAVHPDAGEDCSDGLDNDCDGSVDTEADSDGDGWDVCDGDCDDGNPLVFPSAFEDCNDEDDDCDGLTDENFDMDLDGVTSCAGDCDDGNALARPGLPEICDDVIDNNCDGLIDVDSDVDLDGWTACGGDCDDTDPDRSPGAPETCDGLDNDCDGIPDDGLDIDGDGLLPCTGDCGEGDPEVYPGAVEVCNGIDDDCSGDIDELADMDGDGVNPCEGDCDDGNAEINPDAAELCDGLDNDCDDAIDEGLSSDDDGDGHFAIGGCASPADDCNDAEARVFPGAEEICDDGIDNDCDDLVDGAEPGCESVDDTPPHYGFACNCDSPGSGAPGAPTWPLLLLPVLGSVLGRRRSAPASDHGTRPLPGKFLLFCGAALTLSVLSPAAAAQSELILYGPGDADPKLEGAAVSILKDLKPKPSKTAQARPIGSLSLPVPTFVWAATGGETNLCRGAVTQKDRIVQLVSEGVEFMDYLEQDKARSRFADAEALLPCADEVLDSELLWDLYFSAAILAHQAGEDDEAVRLFRAAALSKPSGTWDPSYAPEAQAQYLKGREAAAVAGIVALHILNADSLLSEVFVDGQPVDLTAESRPISADRHLVQARTRFGQFLSFVLVVSGESDVLLLTGGGAGELLMSAESPTERQAASRLLEANFGRSNLTGLWLLHKARSEARAVSPVDWSLGEITPITLPRSSGDGGPGARAGKGSRFNADITGGLMVYTGLGSGTNLHGGGSLLLGVDVVKLATIEAGLTSSWRRLDANTTAWIPLVRVGARFNLTEGRVRPYVGVAASFTFHDSFSVGVGPVGLAGVRIRLADPVHLRVDVAAGWNKAFVLSAGAGIGFGGLP